jgi:hypothetical protein
MTDKGFLHKAFLGHQTHDVDLPVVMVDRVADIIPTLKLRIARTPRSVLEGAGRAEML